MLIRVRSGIRNGDGHSPRGARHPESILDLIADLKEGVSRTSSGDADVSRDHSRIERGKLEVSHDK